MSEAPPPRVLAITPCHDDGWALADLARSLLEQQVPPTAWIVVDDASEDDTPMVLAELRRTVPFLIALRRERPPGRRIGEKARAVMAGHGAAPPGEYQYVAVLDADVTLPKNYFAEIHRAMTADPRLGVTGGVYLEAAAGPVRTGRSAGAHVPGPAQVFRAEVFEAVGGYAPLPYGGDDVESVSKARMQGWETRALSHLHYGHRRRMGTGGHGSPIRADRNLGRQDYDLGTSPVFELLKLARHLSRRPRGLAAGARALGYFELALRGAPRSVPDEYVRFVRFEQRSRIRRYARRAAGAVVARLRHVGATNG